MFSKTRLATLSIATKRRSARERLGAPGSSGSAPALAHLGMLGALESAWERLEARVLGTPGNAWERLGAPGSAGESRGALGSAWERLGALRSARERLGALGSARRQSCAELRSASNIVDNAARNCICRLKSSSVSCGIAFRGYNDRQYRAELRPAVKIVDSLARNCV